MTDLGVVLAQLKQDRARLDRAIAALTGVVSATRTAPTNRVHRKRVLSVAARRRIAAAQRARWAKVRAKKAS